MSPTVVQVAESWRDAREYANPTLSKALPIDVSITLLAAGLIFLLALVLGVWKYRQVLVSEDHRATQPCSTAPIPPTAKAAGPLGTH